MIFNVLLYLTFILFSFGQLGRISFHNQEVNLYLYELSLLLVVAGLCTKYRFEPVKAIGGKFRFIMFFFGFLFLGFILNFLNFNFYENTVAALYIVRLIFYFSFFFYLYYDCKKNKKTVDVLKNGVVLFVGLTIPISLAQYFFYPDLRNLMYDGWDPHYYRMFGVFFDTSLSGAIYGILFAVVFLYGKGLYNTPVRRVILGILFVFIILTFNRSLYLVFLLSTAAHFILQKKFKTLFLLTCLFGLVLFFAPKPSGEGVNIFRIFSIQSRLTDYRYALKIWERNPLWGVGYNRIRYEKQRLNIPIDQQLDANHAGASFHSSFLIILATTGIIGLILFGLALLQLGSLNTNAAHMVIVVSLLSLTDNILLHPYILFLLFTVLILFAVRPFRRLL